MPPIITLTTDFGSRDHYVAAMKGVILSINPAAQIVDISHEVQPYDVLEGALILAQAYASFPSSTIHVIVVDPGVGTARRPIAVDAGRHQFVAPDNGVLSFVYEREERLSVRHITAEHYFLQPVSATFHGRDVFAPVAAYLSKGTALSSLGEAVRDFVHFDVRRPEAAGPQRLRGVVLRADHFGNLVTNIRPSDVPALFAECPPPFVIRLGEGEIRSLRTTFGEGSPGEVFAIVGSMGFLEIVVNRGSAAATLKVAKASEVTVAWQSAVGP
jgi:hypothetical protein